MRSGTLLLTILSIALMSSPGLAANYFKWTDENGVTHYSARKPVGYEAEVVRISAGGRSQQREEAASNSDTAAPGAETKSQQAAAAPTIEKDPERCDWAKSTLSTLRDSHRVRMQDENGELRYLNDEERAEQQSLAEKAVEEAC